MKRIIVLSAASALCFGAYAGWFWPFGSDETAEKSTSQAASGEEKEEKRLSELMEKASLAIDEAADFQDRGMITQAIAKYREAIAELDRVEQENKERAKTSEFSSLRTKRAYSRSAIASLQMKEALLNAKPVAVTDTTALEKKLAEEKAAREKALNPEKKDDEAKKTDKPKDPKPNTGILQEMLDHESEVSGKKKDEIENASRLIKAKEVVLTNAPPMTVEKVSEAKPVIAVAAPIKASASAKITAPDRKNLRNLAIADIKSGDFASAHLVISEMLNAKPDDPLALNLLGAAYAQEGKIKEAEDALYRCIKANPGEYSAYYNMARLYLKKSPADKNGARRYYLTGRTYGGPKDLGLEGALK